MPNIYKSSQAKEDLINIWSYTNKNWGEKQADLYLDELEKVFQLLVKNPLLCRIREELIPSVRIHHFSHHLIVYKERDKGIHLIRILHESMDYETTLREGMSGLE